MVRYGMLLLAKQAIKYDKIGQGRIGKDRIRQDRTGQSRAWQGRYLRYTRPRRSRATAWPLTICSTERYTTSDCGKSVRTSCNSPCIRTRMHPQPSPAIPRINRK